MSKPAPCWALLLGCSIVCAGVGAGLWKQAGISATKFSVLFVLGKTLACWGGWALLGRRPLIERGAARFWALSCFAAVLNGLAWIAYFVAFERGPLGLVQTLTGAYTAVGALLAILFLRERPAALSALGIPLVLIASMVLGAESEGPGVGGSGGGWMLPGAVAAGLWGCNAALIKYAYTLPGADDAHMYLAHWCGLLVTLLPFGLFFAPGPPWHAGSWLPTLAVVLLYVVSELMLYAATARGPASVVNPIFGLYPGVSIAYGSFVLGELPSRLQWFAMALALAGSVLVASGCSTGKLLTKAWDSPANA